MPLPLPAPPPGNIITFDWVIQTVGTWDVDYYRIVRTASAYTGDPNGGYAAGTEIARVKALTYSFAETDRTLYYYFVAAVDVSGSTGTAKALGGRQISLDYLATPTGVAALTQGGTGATTAAAARAALSAPAVSDVTHIGTTAVALNRASAGLTLDGTTVGTGQYMGALTIAAADTNWWRVATYDGNNQPSNCVFQIVTTNHLSIEVKLSKGAGGDYGVMEVTVLGHYAYWSTYPYEIRIVPTGTNAPTHVDIRLTGGGGNTFNVYKLLDFSANGSRITFPMATTGSTASAGTSVALFGATGCLRRYAFVGNGYTPIVYLSGGGIEVTSLNSGGQPLTFGGTLLGNTSSSELGFSAGSGGTVTQATSKATGVTINKISGKITMNAAALAAGAVVGFTMTNSYLAANDGIIATLDGSTVNAANYNVWMSAGAGAGGVYVKNVSAGSLSEAVVINFQIIKGSAS